MMEIGKGEDKAGKGLGERWLEEAAEIEKEVYLEFIGVTGIIRNY